MWIMCGCQAPVCVESATATMWILPETGETYTETPASVMRGTVMRPMTVTQTTSAQVSGLFGFFSKYCMSS